MWTTTNLNAAISPDALVMIEIQVAGPPSPAVRSPPIMDIPVGLWLYASIAASGFVIGLIFRFPLLIAASAAVAVLLGTLSMLAGFSPLVAIGAIMAGLLTLQIGYLVGVAASYAWSRACACKRGD